MQVDADRKFRVFFLQSPARSRYSGLAPPMSLQIQSCPSSRPGAAPNAKRRRANVPHARHSRSVRRNPSRNIPSRQSCTGTSATGAEVLSLSSPDDANKVFGVSLPDPAGRNSTGVPHILEHSVLCGSRKYPVKEPFVELLKGSLQTFLNAFTYPDKTCYPVAIRQPGRLLQPGGRLPGRGVPPPHPRQEIFAPGGLALRGARGGHDSSQRRGLQRDEGGLFLPRRPALGPNSPSACSSRT